VIGVGLTIALGLALGVILQRGAFCGSSLLSTWVLDRDGRGLIGIGFAIGVSMAGFAVLAALGLVVVDPNPMRLLSAVVGGLVFGVGMVLAGGCVTGTMFKAAEGRLTSILALVGIGIGATAADEGLLLPVKQALVKPTAALKTPPGLHDLLGLSYPVAAGLLAGLLLAGMIVLHARQCRRAGRALLPPVRELLVGAWPPALAGVGVGVLGWLAFLSSTAAQRNYPLGAMGGVRGALSLLVTGKSPGNTWILWLCLGLIAGAALSAALRGGWKLRSAPPETLLIALFGGLLVGIGASFGRGCFMGNMISGLGLLSLHSLVFAAFTVLANWSTTLLYLRGL